MMKAISKKYLLGVGVSDATDKETLEYLLDFLRKSTKKLFVITPNPEILVIANKNFDYRKTLNRANLALADGVGVTLGARFLGKPLKQRVTGVDFVKNLCQAVAKRPITIGFLGGRVNVAEEAAKCLKREYPGLNVAFAVSDLASINDLRCDILFVAYGAPKQELWIDKNLAKLPVKAAMGVGGALDYISGNVPRAPKIVRSLGLEWLFRLIIQPWRIKRQLRLIKFVWLILKEKLFSNS